MAARRSGAGELVSASRFGTIVHSTTVRAVLAALLAVLTIFFGWTPASATTDERAAPPYLAAELDGARLAGQGDYSWFGLSIYRAQLWVGPQGYRAAAPWAAPLVLELRYALTLNGRRIAEASAEQMEKINAGTSAQRAVWLERMREIFPDVQDGSRLAGLFLPGRGVRFYRDGKLLAQVEDVAFAQAFFGIWLDPASSAPRLREALLRDAGPRP